METPLNNKNIRTENRKTHRICSFSALILSHACTLIYSYSHTLTETLPQWIGLPLSFNWILLHLHVHVIAHLTVAGIFDCVRPTIDNWIDETSTLYNYIQLKDELSICLYSHLDPSMTVFGIHLTNPSLDCREIRRKCHGNKLNRRNKEENKVTQVALLMKDNLFQFISLIRHIFIFG